MLVLVQKKLVTFTSVLEPIRMPSDAILRFFACCRFLTLLFRTVHSAEYLESLKKSTEIARITEFSFVSYLPQFVVKNRVINPMLYGTSGSILAGKVAMERGWAINLSGGFHHCSAHQGGGYCCYAV